MNVYRLWVIFGFFLTSGHTVRAETEASEMPAADEIVTVFEDGIKEVKETFENRVQLLRSEYVKEMVRLEESASLQGNITMQLWTNRNLRICKMKETDWLAVFEEDYEVPETLANVNTAMRSAVNTLREKGLVALAESKQTALNELTELEKRQVRADQIDHALLTRKTRTRIEKSKSYPKVEKRLKEFTFERAAKIVRKQENKVEWDPTPPPDAKFLFRKDNPAFQTLLKSVSIESSGFRDGPSARIALGNGMTYTGTRGVAVVAVNGPEILIQDSYDTYAFEQETHRLIEDLKALPYGSVLLLAVRDDATRRFTGSANSTLIRFGARKGILNLPYRSSYLMVGVKGLAPGEALEMDDLGKVRYP